MREAYICAYVRTPIGRYGGSLSGIRADDLAAVPLKALRERLPNLDFEAVDDLIYGCANQAGEDNRNVARMAVLLAGLPGSIPGTTMNRLCGSGMDAVIAAARAIKAGEAEIMIAGGVESMSRAPFVMPKADAAFSRNAEIYDTTIGWRFINPLIKSQYGVDSMPETGENVAADFNVSREDQDAFALRSQKKAAAAQANGRLAGEIVPVTIPKRKGDPVVVDKDEHPRGDTTLEQLAKLPTPFRKDGTVTAGNASGVNDGSAALIVASEEAVRKFGLEAHRPRARRRRCRRRAAHHGHRAGSGHEEALRAARPQADGFRRDRAERGLRQPGHRGPARTRHPGGCRAREPERRRHRARPSARHVRRAHRRHGGPRTQDQRQEARARDHVRRGRAGHCRRHRSRLTRDP